MKKIFIRSTIFLFVLLPFVSLQSAPQSYEHPAGLHFTYPDNWTTNESSFADVEFVPVDQNKGEQGPTEAYFLWGLGLDESRSAQSQIELKLRELMTEIAEFLEQKGEPESFIGKNSNGLIYTWEGIRADGIQVRSRIFIHPEKDIAFILVGLGIHEQIIKRETALTEVFGSFTYKAKSPSKSLSGSWEEADDPSGEQTQTFVHEKNTMELKEDGGFVMINTDSAEDGKITGRWFGEGGKIYFVSPGNVSLTYRYELRGEPGSRKLTLIHPSGDRQEMREASKIEDQKQDDQ